MFVSKRDFDDDFDSRPQTSSDYGQINNRTSGNMASGLGNTGEDLKNSDLTPAMRKAKMDQLRQASLQKRKQKPLGGIMRADSLDRPSSSNVLSVSKPLSAVSTPGVQPLPPNSASFSSHPHSAYDRSNYSRDPQDSGSEDESNLPVAIATELHVDTTVTSGERSNYAASYDRKPATGTYNSERNNNSSHNDREGKVLSQVERDMINSGIAPTFDPIKNISAGVRIDFSDMRNFLTSPLPKGMTMQCYILRNKKGLKNKMYPTYELYHEEGDRFLLAAKKRTKNKTSNYLISMDKTNLQKESASYLGKVRSNFVGTEFVGYDKGINPKEVDSDTQSISAMTVRQELSAVFYESNILGSRGPRKMTAVVPTMKKDGTRSIWRPMKNDDSISTQFKLTPNKSDYMILQNKTPKWNDQVGAYVLNFNGRVTMASVKNFQLIHSDDPESVLLQFGRVGKDTFSMDFQYPLSALQAYQICLSSFDYKLACE